MLDKLRNRGSKDIAKTSDITQKVKDVPIKDKLPPEVPEKVIE